MSAPAHEHGFLHEAFFYADSDELLGRAVPFVRAGLEGQEAVLVALPQPTLELLQGALGDDCELVQFAVMEELGRNPARIISAWRDFIDAHVAEDRAARGIGEPIWVGRSAAELEECERHESLLNLAFANDPPWSLMCPYNTAELDDRTLSAAARNHPVLSGAEAAERSGSYAGPLSDGGPFTGKLDPPPAATAELGFTAQGLGDVRRFVGERALREGLAEPRTADLILAADEAATNSIRHGGGEGSVRMWRERDAVVCEVGDRGRIGQDKSLIGRQRPPAEGTDGRGVWIANQLCDLVQIRSGESGSAVRLSMSLDA